MSSYVLHGNPGWGSAIVEAQLDEEQRDATLELKLYRLARLEINLVTDELKEKAKRAKESKEGDEVRRISVLAGETATLALVEGTRDPERARAAVARWIGM